MDSMNQMCLAITTDALILITSSMSIIGVALWVLGNAIQSKMNKQEKIAV